MNTGPLSIHGLHIGREVLNERDPALHISQLLHGSVAVICGLEDVERVSGGTRDDSRQLRVPVYLLDVLLSLVYKVELRRHVLRGGGEG